jgi:hypothetical protein
VISLSGLETLAQRRLSPITLVPPTSVAVVKVNWAVTRKDDRLRAMVKGDQLERVLGTMGVNGDDVAEFVIFSGFNTTPSGTMGMILSGSYDSQQIIGHIKSQGWDDHLYKAHKIYSHPSDNSWMALMRSNLLVAGTRAGVERALDVELSPQTALTTKPPFSSVLARFTASRHPISFMMGLPPEYQAVADVAVKVVSVLISFPGTGPLGWVIGKIGWPRTLGFSISKQGSSFPVELVAVMKDATAAGIVSGTLNLIQGIDLSLLSKSMPQSDREALQNMAVTQKGALLSIKMLMRDNDLPRL